MEDFSALAARVAAGVGELRGVLVLSRDGLVLGAFPEADDALVKPAWLRFAGLGEPDKGFIEFADEVWAYVRRGPYASFAVTGAHVRPGLVMDQLEQMLVAAEEVRAKREAVRVPDAAPAPSDKPRTPPRAEARSTAAPPSGETAGARPPQPSAADAAARPTPPQAPAGPGRSSSPQAPPAPVRPGVPVGAALGGQPPGPQPPAPRIAPASDVSGPPSTPSPAPGTGGGPERPPAPTAATASPPAASRPGATGQPDDEDEAEVDPVLLAQEFSRLLQETEGADET